VEEDMQPGLTLKQGDWVEQLKTIPDCSIQCCVTSPPYWGLRSYLPKGHPLKPMELGQEKTPEEYVAKMVEGFREVRRVLKPDGTLWLNLGDSYASGSKGGGGDGTTSTLGPKSGGHGISQEGIIRSVKRQAFEPMKFDHGLKPKNLVGIPWRVAFALQSDGWWLRQDIIWAKPNPMPESVTDRCTRSHEYIFMFTKSAKYFYDHNAIKEQPSPDLIKQIEDGYNGHAVKDYLGMSVQDASATKSRIIDGHRKRIDKQRGHGRRHNGFNDKWDALTPDEQALCGCNKRSVWTVSPANFREAHFATFPPELIKPCILAGSKPGDTIIDPFGGSGTVGQVGLEYGRSVVLIELNPEYHTLIEKRCNITAGLAL
jgi:DNA modification methylase